MMPAEPSREDVMIRSLSNRMVTSSPLRPYGYRPVVIHKIRATVENQPVVTPPASEPRFTTKAQPADDFQGGHNID